MALLRGVRVAAGGGQCGDAAAPAAVRTLGQLRGVAGPGARGRVSVGELVRHECF